MTHIAVVPDGNRRWSKKNSKPEWYGHLKGAKKLEEFLDWVIEHPEINMVSIYALSTENLNRSENELAKLWDIYNREFKKLMKSKKIRDNDIRINIIGETNQWRPDVRHVAKGVMHATKNYTKSVLNILLAYGSQAEIMSAVKQMAKAGVRKIPYVRDMLHSYLMVNVPVDLIIRTGGQYRLSNFLLYQCAYSEIYFSKTLWPDFTKAEFERILRWYERQEKKHGK